MTERQMKRVGMAIYILGGLCAITGIGAGIYTADAAADPAWDDSVRGMILVGLGFLCAILGFVAAILAVTLATWMEQMCSGDMPAATTSQAHPEATPETTEPAGEWQASLTTLSKQVFEINEVLLLSDPERASRRSRLDQEAVESLAAQVDSAVATPSASDSLTMIGFRCCASASPQREHPPEPNRSARRCRKRRI